MVLTRTTKNLLWRATVAALMVVTAFVATDGQRASAATAVGVSGGSSHTCAVTTGGGLKCWGLNVDGQLGDGTSGFGSDRPTPVDVVGLTSGVAAVSAGDSHTCALTTAGGLKCWGTNLNGQLGDGRAMGIGSGSTTPVDVVGLTSGVAAVSAGHSHTCALTTAGGVKCWGFSGNGQLGNGTSGFGSNRPTPVDVVGLTSGVAAVSAGSNHTCALTTEGGLQCWGSGGLGAGTLTTRTATPVDVVGLTSGVAAVSAGGEHTCALTTAGGLKCWGFVFSGQLRDATLATLTSLTTPVDVTGLTSGVAAVSAGASHTCAVTTAGGLKCWGFNGSGRLGDGTLMDRSTPVDVVGLTSGVAAVSAGDRHTCAMTTGGGLKCWGRNFEGQLGDGTPTFRTTLVDVVGLTNGVAAVSAGFQHTCALTTSGGLKCWGWNGSGRLGDGTLMDRSTPVDVAGLTSGVAAVSAGSGHTCAVTTAGGLKCWGFNGSGRLGDGTLMDRSTPVDVVGLTSGVAAVSAGAAHTCAVKTGGGLKCWGFGSVAPLTSGAPTPTPVPSPTPTPAQPAATAVSAGGRHTCAVTTAGGLKCWGSNFFGQLGDGTTTFRGMPVDVSGLTSSVAAVSAGSDHTCAVVTAGGLKCWGRNGSGQLGDGTAADRTTPVDVVGLTSGVAAVAAGIDHTCAVTTAGRLNCWGSDGSGQLGAGTTLVRATPVDVVGFAGVVPTPTPVLPKTGGPIDFGTVVLIALILGTLLTGFVAILVRGRRKRSA